MSSLKSLLEDCVKEETKRIRDGRKHIELRAELEVDPELLKKIMPLFVPVDSEIKYNFRMSHQQAKELSDKYGVDPLIDALNHAITVLKMPVPLPPRDITARDQDFSNLKKIKVRDVVRYKPYQHLYPYKYPLDDALFGMITTGNKSSSFFNEMSRADLTSKNGNISGLWNDPGKRRSALNFIKLSMKREYIINSTLLSAMKQRGTAAAQFRPAVAKALFEFFKAERIYDPCSGWGDRLVAALACDRVLEYHGVDANGDLQKMYTDMISTYNKNDDEGNKTTTKDKSKTATVNKEKKPQREMRVITGCAEEHIPQQN